MENTDNGRRVKFTTDKEVAKLPLPEGGYDRRVADAELRGFKVRVMSTGARHFEFNYKFGGVSRRVALGTFGEVSTKEARKQAERLRGEVLAGRDPWAERRDDRSAALAAEAGSGRLHGGAIAGGLGPPALGAAPRVLPPGREVAA